MTYTIKIDGTPTDSYDTQEAAITAAQHQRPKPHWVEVISPEGRQVFAEHEFEYTDHLQAAQTLIGLLEGSDSGLPSDEALDHIRRTVSVTQTVLLTLPGRYGYAGVELTRYQLIAKPTQGGCNKHFYVITEGYSEGYRANLYETKADALKALLERVGSETIPVAALF